MTRCSRTRYTAAGSQRICLSRECSGRKSARAKAQSWEVCDERLDWPDPELTHIRLHRTIYYSLDGRVQAPVDW
jgi:hypothetical protein